MTDLQSLIARVEAATGPDRKLEAEIALASGWITFELKGFGVRWQRGHGTVEKCHPPFTSSIDAALTLVPDAHHAAFFAAEAIDRIKYQHVIGAVKWPATSQAYAELLARFISAAALRAAQGEG